MSRPGHALAAAAAVAALAGPRRTRPLAGIAYGVILSRLHGANLEAIGRGALRAARAGADLHEAHTIRMRRLELRLDTLDDATSELMHWLGRVGSFAEATERDLRDSERKGPIA